MSRLKVLLVDDDPDNRTIGELSLARVGGCEVTTAGSGAEAVDLARRVRPEVILLDVVMPDMDGPTTLARLREALAPAAVPVVFLTARTRPAEVVGYLEMGAVGVIGKPFDPMTLPDQLRAILARGAGRPGPS